MWHASAAGFSRDVCRTKAFSALADVGAAELGEWEEWTGKAYHIRRRLATAEEEQIGPSVDVRGTDEARKRVESLLAKAPYIRPEYAYEEAGIKVW